MSQVIPENYLDILEKPAFAHLGTLMPNGSPQVTPVWVDYDGKHVRINSARGRVKDKNMRRDPRVSLSLQDPANPYRYLEVRGASWKSRRRARTITSTNSRKNILASPILTAGPARCASPTSSSRKKSAPWVELRYASRFVTYQDALNQTLPSVQQYGQMPRRAG